MNEIEELEDVIADLEEYLWAIQFCPRDDTWQGDDDPVLRALAD